MTGNVTIQSVNFTDVDPTYTLGLISERIVNYYTKAAADTGYTATSVIVYDSPASGKVIYGVSQSVAQIQALFYDVTQAELNEVIDGIGANADGTYNTPDGSNFLDSTTTVMDALGEIDSQVGAATTPVVRTNNPIVADNSSNENIDALDSAIGTDAQLTVVTRTTGQLAVDSSVMTKFDVIDAGIGFDAQLSGVPKNISKNNTIYQNLEALDTYKTVRTIKKTVAWSGANPATVDFLLPSDANMTPANIDLGSIIPINARVIDGFVKCTSATTFSGGPTTLVAGIGNASGGAQISSSGTIYALNAINGNGAAFNTPIAISASASKVWLTDVTPGANWSTQTAGIYTVYITFVDVSNV